MTQKGNHDAMRWIAVAALLAALAWAAAPTVAEELAGPTEAEMLRASTAGQKTSPTLQDSYLEDPLAEVDVIVLYRQSPKSGDLEEIGLLGGTIGRSLGSVNGVAAKMDSGTVMTLAEDPDVEWIAPDAMVGAALDVARPTANAEPYPAGAQGYPEFDGSGVTVAVLDSGVLRHQDLGRRLIASVSVIADESAVRPVGPRDPFGHGTHVAGIVAGDGAGSEGLYRGSAPGADVVSVRVLDDQGMGTTSGVIAGLHWVVQNKEQYGIRVVNLSLGHPPFDPAAKDPLVRAVESAVEAGLVVVCSAGNFGGYGYFTISSPGNAPSAITAGSLTDWNTALTGDDMVSSFSSRGPSLVDHYLKPDLLAPGNRIVSLRSAGSTLDSEWPDKRVQAPGSPHVDYYELSGTSMAAPFLAGVAAAMIGKEPGLNPGTVKARLMRSAVKGPGNDPFARGAGLVDVAAALEEDGYVDAAPSPSVSRADECCDLLVADMAALWGDERWSDGVLWSDGALWSDGVLWSDSVLWSDGALWSDSVLWSDGVLWSDSVLWSDGVLWSDFFPEAD